MLQRAVALNLCGCGRSYEAVYEEAAAGSVDLAIIGLVFGKFLIELKLAG